MKSLIERELQKLAQPGELQTHIKNIKSKDRVQMQIGIIALRKVLAIGI